MQCPYCNCQVLDNDVESHNNGKRHKTNMQRAQQLEQSSRKLYVGIRGLNYPQKSLYHYFIQFGLVLHIKLQGMAAFVEMGSVDAVQRALGQKRHYIEGMYVPVRRFEMRRTPGQIHHEQMEKEKVERNKTHDWIVEMLEAAHDVNEQLKNLSSRMKLDAEDDKVRKHICDSLERIFSPYFTSCQIHPFGSSVNSFGFKGCDLDLFLDLSCADESNKKPPIQLPFQKDIKSLRGLQGPLTAQQLKDIPLLDQVKLLSRILSSQRTEFSDTMAIPSHRCPVAKFKHSVSNISCDLSINNRKALHNSHLLRWYGSDVRVHRVVCAVRLWAREQLLSGMSQGHLFTNYAVTWLALFYLQNCSPPVLPCVAELDNKVKGLKKEDVDGWPCVIIPQNTSLPPSENTQSEMSLLQGFFDFYANKVNWDVHGLCTQSATVDTRINQAEKYADLKLGFMTMTDPFLLCHNITGNINEKTKFRFMVAVKKAAEMSSEWGDGSKGKTSGSWGLAALLEPIPESVVEKESPKKSEKKLMEGEQPSGVFELVLRPPGDGSLPQRFKEMVVETSIRRDILWCRLAQKMMLSVLTTVFLVQIAEQEEEVENVMKEEEKADEAKSSKLNQKKESKHGAEMKKSMSVHSKSPAHTKAGSHATPSRKNGSPCNDEKLEAKAVLEKRPHEPENSKSRKPGKNGKQEREPLVTPCKKQCREPGKSGENNTSHDNFKPGQRSMDGRASDKSGSTNTELQTGDEEQNIADSWMQLSVSEKGSETGIKSTSHGNQPESKREKQRGKNSLSSPDGTSDMSDLSATKSNLPSVSESSIGPSRFDSESATGSVELMALSECSSESLKPSDGSKKLEPCSELDLINLNLSLSEHTETEPMIVSECTSFSLETVREKSDKKLKNAETSSSSSHSVTDSTMKNSGLIDSNESLTLSGQVSKPIVENIVNKSNSSKTGSESKDAETTPKCITKPSSLAKGKLLPKNEQSLMSDKDPSCHSIKTESAKRDSEKMSPVLNTQSTVTLSKNGENSSKLDSSTSHGKSTESDPSSGQGESGKVMKLTTPRMRLPEGCEGLDSKDWGQSVRFSCHCDHQMWNSRKKIMTQLGLPKGKQASGLDIEQHISQLIVSQPQLLAGPPAQGKNTGPPAQGKNTGPPAQGKNTGPPAQGKNTGPPAQGKNTGPPAQEKNMGKSAQEKKTGSGGEGDKSGASKPEPQTHLSFSCVVDQIYASQSLSERVCVLMKPDPKCINNFRVFFSSFRAILSKLVQSHLMDAYEDGEKNE